MASSSELRLKDSGYKRYILSGLGLDYLCKTLASYEKAVICKLHSDMLMVGHLNPHCHTKVDSYKTVCKCPSCGGLVRFLDSEHIYKSVKPGWSNSDITMWHTQPWSLALLFMNRGQDLTINRNPEDTDISGAMNLITHCNRFQVDRAIVEEIRCRRNTLIHHSPNFSVSVNDYETLMDLILKLLVDPDVCGHLITPQHEIQAELQKMKKMTFDVTFVDEIKVFQASLDEIKNMLITGEKEASSLVEKMNEYIRSNSDLYSELKPIVDRNTAEIQQVSKRVHALEDQHTAGIEEMGQFRADVGRLDGDVAKLKEKHDAVKPAITDDIDLRQKLVQCYTQRPEYHRVSPLLDEDIGDYSMDSIHVQVEIGQQDRRPNISLATQSKGDTIQDALDILPTQGQRVSLEGIPGSGKSFLLTLYAREWSKRANKEGSTQSEGQANSLDQFTLLLLLQTRSLDVNVYHTIKCLVWGFDSQTVTPDDIQRVLTSCTSTLLILDGYDEGTDQQKMMIDDVISFKILPHINVLVSSRPGFLKLVLFKECYINRGFNKDQQRKFMDNFISMQNPEGQENMKRFKQRYEESKDLQDLFTAPMMAMTTSTMAASGYDVDFECRTDLFQELVEFVIERACRKTEGAITEQAINELLPPFQRATFEQLVEKKLYFVSQSDIESDLSTEQIHNILRHIGFVSVTKYLHGRKVWPTFTYSHKTIAEFMGARHLVSLDTTTGAQAMRRLINSGVENLEIVKMALGLCSKKEPEHLIPLVRSIVTSLLHEDELKDARKKFYEHVINADFDDYATTYFFPLLADIDIHILSNDVLHQLVLQCSDIIEAKMYCLTFYDRCKHFPRTIRGPNACQWYGVLQLEDHRLQHSLNRISQLVLTFFHINKHRLEHTLVTCAPHMTSLTKVTLNQLTSIPLFGEICQGLVASGLPCLTHLCLTGVGNVQVIAGGNLHPLADLISKATKLQLLNIKNIHAAAEAQLGSLCAAIRDTVPDLKYLQFSCCSVPVQLYDALLLPALLRSRKLSLIIVQHTEKDGDDVEEWGRLHNELREVAGEVRISKQ